MSLKAKSAIRAATILAAASALFSASQAEAGGFGGPGPFRNGSPLVTGTDGVYQCVATGKNSTGIISWAITNGAQTASTTANDWIFFADGQILSGQTSVNISNGKVAGILDSGVNLDIPSAEDGSASLPLVFIIPGNASAGSFSGKIDLNSPIGAINGSGILTGTPDRVDQLIIISEIVNFSSGGNGTFSESPVTVTPIVVPGSTLETLNFKIRGSRLSTSGS